MITLGTIQVDLVANTVSFSQGMTKAAQISLNSSRNIQRSLNLVSVAATAMATGVIASLTAIIDKTEDYVFSLQKAADAAGASTEMFSKLAYNAKLAGVPMDTLKMSMERLGRTAGAAQSGQKQSIAAYAALGISVKDLNGPLSNSGDLMVAVASKLDRYKDSTAKTYLEQTLLGRSGAELAPLLHQLATGFDEAANQATLFGVVVGPETAKQAQQLHTSMVQLESVALGFSMRLLSGVSPALQEVAQKIVTMSTSADGMRTVGTIASDLATIIRGLGAAFQFLFDHAGAVKLVLEGLVASKTASFFLPMIGSAIKAGKGFDDVGLGALKLIGRLSGLGSLVNPFKVLVAGAGEAGKSLRDIWSLETTLAGNTNSLGRAWIAIRSPVMGATAAMKALAAAEGTAAFAGAALDMVLAVMFAPITLAIGVTVGALTALGGTLLMIKGYADQSSKGAATWGDVWHGALQVAENQVLRLKLAMDDLTHSLDAQDLATIDNIKRYGILGQGISAVAAAAANARTAFNTTGLGRFLNATNLKDPGDIKKADAPPVPKDTVEKVDPVEKKLTELRDAANASQQALADVGKGVDFERADTAASESKKIIDELNVTLAAKHDKLTAAEEAQIRADVATKVNNESETKYLDTLKKATDQAIARAQAQDILTAAVGKSAAAQRATQMEADRLTREAGQGDDWKNKHGVENSGLDLSEQKARDSANAAADANSLQSMQEQIKAQTDLNAAILKGKDARDAATLANEQAQIHADFAKRQDVTPGAEQAALKNAQDTLDLTKQKAILELALSMMPAQRYQEQANDIQAAAKAAADAGQAIDSMQLAAANKANLDSYLDAIDKAKLATGGLTDGVGVFFSEMSRESASAAQEMTRVLGDAFESINGMMEKLIEGQRINFASLFRGMSAQLAKIGLQRGEQGLAGIFTQATKIGSTNQTANGSTGTGAFNKAVGALTGQKADPTVTALAKTNDLLADIRTNTMTNGGTGSPITSGMGSVLGDVAGGGAGKSYGTSMISTMTSAALSMVPGGGLFSSILGGFGGHRATGGPVQAGVTYDVGEMGRESFTPTQNGVITPNNRLSGGTPAIHIDARGSNDPAQTEAAIHRAFAVYSPHIVAASQRAAADHAKRSPSKGR